MSKKVKRVRKFGFRLFNAGGRSKKKTIAVLIIVGILSVAVVLLLAIKSHTVKSKTYKYLKDNNIEISEIKEVSVKYSVMNRFLSYGAWTISVEYHDEPNVKYMYTYSDEEIVFAGIGGGDRNKEKSEYKHIE